MNVREYFQMRMSPVCGGAIIFLDKVHPNNDPKDHTTFGEILATMPADSPCGTECISAIDNAAAVCQDIRNAFGDDKTRLFENVVYANLRTLSCFICG